MFFLAPALLPLRPPFFAPLARKNPCVTRFFRAVTTGSHEKPFRDVRSGFLDFFAERGHTEVPSSPLVPRNDPTLLFTTAGMVQFRNLYTGAERRPYTRAITVQKGPGRRLITTCDNVGLHRAPPHLLRDARQLLVRRLLQGPRDRAWRGFRHFRCSGFPRTGFWSRSIPPTIRRSAVEEDRRAFRRKTASSAPTISGDGSHRPLRSLLGDLLRSRALGVRLPRRARGDQDGDRYMEFWNLVFMQFEQRRTRHPPGPAGRRSTPAWASSGSPPSCRASPTIMTSTCSVRWSGSVFGRWRREARDAPRHRIIADHLRATSSRSPMACSPPMRAGLCAAAPHAPGHAPRALLGARHPVMSPRAGAVGEMGSAIASWPSAPLIARPRARGDPLSRDPRGGHDTARLEPPGSKTATGSRARSPSSSTTPMASARPDRGITRPVA